MWLTETALRSRLSLYATLPGVAPGAFPVLPCIVRSASRVHDASRKPMKMLFFSADNAEVEEVSREFEHASIPCEVRNTRFECCTPESELWIRDDRDCHRAFMLCVQLGVGFAKRPPHAELDEEYAEYETDA